MKNDCFRLAFIMVAAAGLWAAPQAADAQSPAGPGDENVARLTLHPVAVTSQAWRYALLPDWVELTPGNAAPLYMGASKLGLERGEEDHVYRYLNMPLKDLPSKEASELLSGFADRLREADIAAHRRDAVWDSSIVEEGANARLPYLNDLWGLAALWRLQARLQIARKDWPAARRTLGDELTLACQLNNQAPLVQGLEEANIASRTLSGGVRDWIAQPDAPNLYWALSGLPQPFVDLRGIEQWERAMPYFSFPTLARARSGSVSAEEWRQFIAQLHGLSAGRLTMERPTPKNEAEAALLVVSAYPAAVRYLIDSGGSTRRQLEAMPMDEAVGLYFLGQYQDVAADAWKAWQLPYWQGRETLLQARQDIRRHLRRGADSSSFSWESELGEWDWRLNQHDYDNPLLAFIPSLERARRQLASLDRECAMLRIAEAVRDYAARHGGAPPTTLQDIKDLPIPFDPVTGTPFEYQANGQTATLKARSPGSRPQDAEQYLMTLVK